ncbi:phosphatidate cytidylyltransferase [Kaistia dalseonensis]|uniref:Phosphatidate cytidylyltransferase n=1 Tax=Kaistia dalseonensis TaxID=410840 RepID=A0ABU0HCE5_9HYPH|nr:phosphatidate cytidylyltransferase [Kaistia dalseonensis]MCX5497348.1 phosphatidate cytidylyltransferase [Kaistia dalseonensis]MDQ0439985.1 phosphatidate cytidylyltransferase [Kaistia dalseonensis]
MSDIAFRFMMFGLPLELVATLAIVMLGLVVATLFAWFRPVPADDAKAIEKSAELKARIGSWWVMVLVLVAAFLLGRTAMVVLFAFVSFVALKEYLTMIPTRKADRVVLLVAYLAVPIQYRWVGIGWYGMFVIFVPVYMFLILPAAMVLRGETTGFLKAAGTLHWGLMITVFAVSHAAFLIAVPPPQAPAGTGEGLLLFLLIATEFNDVAQFIAGRTFGRRKITPKVSPNKTVEGFVGGLLATTLLSTLLAPTITPIMPLHAALVGALIATAGFFGDIVMSAVKRDLGIKDTGTMLPGHGGILDRIDSLVFTAPLFFHAVRYLYF